MFSFSAISKHTSTSPEFHHQSWLLLPWAIFLLVPFLTPNIFQAPTAIGLMAFATALFAAGWMQLSNKNYETQISFWPWLFLILCLIPTFTLLMQDNINSPWLLWRQTLYLTAAWLIYTMSSSHSARLLQSPQWASLLSITAHLYIIYALLQTFDLRFPIANHDSLFLFWSTHTANFPGPLMQRNMQSLFLVVCIAFLWMQMIKSYTRWVWNIATILPLCGLLLTASRSGILILSIAIICILVVSQKRLHDAAFILLSIILAWLLYTWIISVPITETSATGIIERIETSAVLPRILIWAMSFNIFLSHPWFGVGWGNLPAHGMDGIAMTLSNYPFLEDTASTMPYAHVWSHNIILQFLAEGGVWGGAAIFMILIALGKQGWKWIVTQAYHDDERIYGWLMSILILAHGMVSISLMQPFFMCLLALSLSACFSPVLKKRKS